MSDQTPLVTIGDWEVLLSTSLILGQNEEARLVITPDDPLYVRIRLESLEPEVGEKKVQRLQAFGTGNDGGLLFINWDNQLGSATKQPIEFAVDDRNRIIAAMCIVRAVGTVRHLVLQFMRRESK